MQTSLWVIFVIVAGFVGFLIGISQPQYQPRPAVTTSAAQTTTMQQYAVNNRDRIEQEAGR